METRDWSGEGWRLLPDDGRRYYADPFPLLIDGRLHVFFEDLDLATRHGVISASVLGPDGFSPPRTVLARPYHLSYPQVFADGDGVYMLPESSGARRLELWRAERVPDRWALDTVLLEWEWGSVAEGAGDGKVNDSSSERMLLILSAASPVMLATRSIASPAVRQRA